MLLFQMYKLQPETVANIHSVVNQKLCDVEFSVVHTALNIMHELVKVISSHVTYRAIQASLLHPYHYFLVCLSKYVTVE